MSTTSRGRTAESLAAGYLHRQGYEILDRNWRNRWCEIDIVAQRAGIIHIVEVKYRRSVDFGYAAEYVSRDKIIRLRRAALAWLVAHPHRGDYRIDVVTVEGELASPAIALIEQSVYN